MKTILKTVTTRESIHNIVKVIKEDLNLDEKGKELILRMLAVAWIEGASLALFWPQGVSDLLVGSREQRDMVSDTMESIILHISGRRRQKLSQRELRRLVRAMMEQEEVAPFSRINLETGYVDTLLN